MQLRQERYALEFQGPKRIAVLVSIAGVPVFDADPVSVPVSMDGPGVVDAEAAAQGRAFSHLPN